MNSQQGMQTVQDASSSIGQVVQSSFTSLANILGLPQLKESFFQNIIYILITIIIFIGILVYIQMIGSSGDSPLNSPPTKQLKKVEIKRIVEGFDVESGFDITENTAPVQEVGIVEHSINDDNDTNNFLEDYSVPNIKKKYKSPFNVEESFFNRRSE